MAPALLDSLAIITDPRSEKSRKHPLETILTLAICAVIAGADNWVAIYDWSMAKRDWLKSFVNLENGVPSHDTFGRVFAALDPDEFQQGFIDWTAGLAESLDGCVVAIDGKTLRRSFDRANERRAIHMVSAWVTGQSLSLGQVKTAEKSNEITAIPVLLRKLKLKGAIVTIDAMGCQTKITSAIRAQGADYVIAVKNNQPKLFELIQLWTAALKEHGDEMDVGFASTEERNHGREETRKVWVAPVPLEFSDGKKWEGLRSIACVESTRKIGDKSSIFHRYYISSLPPNEPEKFLRSVREHWGIENSLHWVLDMAFREDESRIRVDNAAENMARLRQIAINLIKREPSRKVGVKIARLRAGWDNDYLVKVLGTKIP